MPACNENDEFTSSPRENFEALWQLIDEHYCFFDYKGIDWNAVHDKYSVQISDTMDKYHLFNMLGLMLEELKDGHTNLISSFQTSRYWKWYEQYPDNFNTVVHNKYLGTDYRLSGGMKYTIMRDSIGYVYYGDFSNAVGESNLDEMFYYFKDCGALIIDVRQNSGGSLLYSERIASRFMNDSIFGPKMTCGYIMHKTGKGHNDFSEPYPIELEASKRVRWYRPVAVLTNRRSYSATNDFVNKMKMFPQVTIIGDRTGGGCGLPFNSEIPIGWNVRFSSSPMLDVNKQLTEFGIEPDIKINIKESDQLNGFDTIIETALDYLKKEVEKKKNNRILQK